MRIKTKYGVAVRGLFLSLLERRIQPGEKSHWVRLVNIVVKNDKLSVTNFAQTDVCFKVVP
jgi:hypothetical protein